VLGAIDGVPVDDRLVFAAVNGWKLFFGNLSDQTLGAQTVCDQIGNGQHLQSLLLGEAFKTRQQ
jgi:hypothetical protein